MSRPIPVALPFDPNPRRPRTALPPGACDTHFHVFGPPNLFPYAATRRYEPPAGPIEYYLAMQRITGLERGVAVQPSAHGYDHAALLDAIARSGGRLKGVANMNAAMSEAELDRLKAAGVVGARFSLMSDRPGDRAAIEHAIPRLQRLDWSLDLHIEAQHLVANETFIRTIPVTTVIDHMGRPQPSHGLDQPAFRLMLDLLKDDRFWVKISGLDKLSDAPQASVLDQMLDSGRRSSSGCESGTQSKSQLVGRRRRLGTKRRSRNMSVPDGIPFTDTIPFARACIDAAPDRCIWGTDWPHGNTFEPGTIPNDGALLDLLIEIAGDQATLRRILVDNPARLYGFN